jgi:hypothetical protein
VIFDDLLLRLERRHLVQPERADGHLDKFAFGYAGGFALLAQKVAARFGEWRERCQAHQL